MPAVKKSDLKERNYYLKNIPATSADFKKSDSLILAALYKIGVIYQNDLVDLPKAIETYDRLLKRFPDSKTYAPENLLSIVSRIR